MHPIPAGHKTLGAMFELLLGAVLQVVINQRSGRRILTSQNLAVTLNSGNQVQRQLLTELNTPLVEGVNTPNNTLNEGDVLVQGNQGAQNARGRGAAPLMEVEGRLPLKIRALTTCSAVPSARTSSSVLPNARA